MTDRRFSFVVNTAFFTILAALFYISLRYLFPLLLPFIIAFISAAALQRPIILLSSRLKRIPKVVTAALVITVLLCTAGLAAALIISALVKEISDFLDAASVTLYDIAQHLLSDEWSPEELINRIPSSLGRYASELLSQLRSDVPGTLLSIADSLSGFLINSVGAIGGVAMRLPSFIIEIFITIILIFFIGLDYEGAKRSITELIPNRFRVHIIRIKKLFLDTLLCMAKTYAFLMLMTFTELAVGFELFNLFGANIPYPVPLALLTAIVDILPVLGVGTVLIPWALFDFISGSISRGIMLLVLYAIIVIIRNFLEPKLVGQRFGLHPALTLLSIYFGGRLFGFTGVFLFPLSLIIARRMKASAATHLSGEIENVPFDAQ